MFRETFFECWGPVKTYSIASSRKFLFYSLLPYGLRNTLNSLLYLESGVVVWDAVVLLVDADLSVTCFHLQGGRVFNPDTDLNVFKTARPSV